GAGISRNVTYFNIAAQDIVVVTAPEPTAITDAYAMTKVLSQKYRVPCFKILVNMVEAEGEGKEVFRKLSAACDRFLNISLDYLGYILVDENLSQAVRQQRALQELKPRSPASRCMRELAERLLKMPRSSFLSGGVQFFWRSLLKGEPR
ncbi:MAG: flagellar synthesis regulator FleN, partial [Nitrospinota bacterium]